MHIMRIMHIMHIVHIMNVSNVTKAVPNTQFRYFVYQSYPLNVSRLGLVTHSKYAQYA